MTCKVYTHVDVEGQPALHKVSSCQAFAGLHDVSVRRSANRSFQQGFQN